MNNKYLIAYVTDRNLVKVTPDDAKRLTHINLAFGKVFPDGNMDDHEMEHMDHLKMIRAWNPDMKILLSVGGWGAGNFSTMALTEERRERFACSCKKFVDQYDLDGIDIDWEYPCSDSAGIDADPADKQNFTALMQKLRDVLGTEKLLSIAAGAGAYFVRDTEMDKVSQICDYIQLMTYDMRSGFDHEAGHHTALYAAEGDNSGKNTEDVVEMFHKAGVPYEKTVIGAAFYSRKWDGVPNVNNGMLQQAESIGQGGPRYSDIIFNYLNQKEWKHIWDEKAKASYLFNGSSLISYDDPESLKEKCRYLLDKGLLGIMYWEHGCDDTHTLLKTLADSLGKE